MNESVNKIQKEVEKENKKEKMDYHKEEIFSSSSDEDDKEKTKSKKKNKKSKKLKHAYSQKKLIGQTPIVLPAITEED